MARKRKLKIPDSVREIANKFSNMACELNMVERPDDEPFFAESYLSEKFDAARAVRLLSDPAPSFYGHKATVYAALCGWMLDPAGEQIILDMVVQTVARLLAEAEKEAAEITGISPIEADMIARYFIAGPQFIEQIYHGIAGMALLDDIASMEANAAEFAEGDRQQYTVLEMMRYCHYWASNPSPNIVPSVNRAVNVMKKLNESKAAEDSGFSSKASIYEHWGGIRETIALNYAANSIIVGDDEDGYIVLLNEIRGGTAEYEKHKKFLGELFGRARFVCDHILKKMPDQSLFEANIAPLREVDAIPFSHGQFKNNELEIAQDERLLKKSALTRLESLKESLEQKS
jgi:hypothetical protein